MVARTRSRVTPRFKTRYRVKNWATCEAALKRRGAVRLVRRGRHRRLECCGPDTTERRGGPAASTAAPTWRSSPR